jgi:hypothetical protein
MTQRETGVPLSRLFDVVRFLRISSDHRSLLLDRSCDGSAMNRRRGLRDGRRGRRRRVLLLHRRRRSAAVTLCTAPAPRCRFETFHRLVEAWAALYCALLLL